MELQPDSKDKNTTNKKNKKNTNEEEIEWMPPSMPGLNNSEQIIPTYYLKKTGLVNEEGEEIKYINIDYLSIIKDDIRNLRKLNKYQIDYIKNNVDAETKNEIMDELIHSNRTCIDIINEN